VRYDAEKHNRRSIRLKGYNYSQAGAYFVTICTNGHECLFGTIVDGNLRLNYPGEMIMRWWRALPDKFSNAQTDQCIVMPNHFHGIIIIVGVDQCVCPDVCVSHEPSVCPEHSNETRDKGEHGDKGEHIGSPLPRIIQWFKTMTTNAYIKKVHEQLWQPFNGNLWQRNYYEHVIRTEKELNQIREYIVNNPMQWELDTENPQNIKGSKLRNA